MHPSHIMTQSEIIRKNLNKSDWEITKDKCDSTRGHRRHLAANGKHENKRKIYCTNVHLRIIEILIALMYKLSAVTAAGTLRRPGHFKPLLLMFPRNAHETGAFAGVRLVPIFVGTPSPLFLLALRLGTGRRASVWLPTRGLRFPPWRSIGVPSGMVCVLVLVWLAVRASSSNCGFATLAFAVTLGLALATVLVGVVLATGLATGVLGLKLDREALLVVALVLVVLPLATEPTGDCTPVVVWQLGLAAGVGLLLRPLDHEAVPLVAVRGMKQGALLISGITPVEVLDVAHDTSIFGGSPLSWLVSLVPTALAPRAASSRTVGVQVLVAFFLQRQLQK